MVFLPGGLIGVKLGLFGIGLADPFMVFCQKARFGFVISKAGWHAFKVFLGLFGKTQVGYPFG